MSWKSGSALAYRLVSLVVQYLPKEVKIQFLTDLCECFEDMDCDTLYELESIEDPDVKKFIRQRYAETEE